MWVLRPKLGNRGAGAKEAAICGKTSVPLINEMAAQCMMAAAQANWKVQSELRWKIVNTNSRGGGAMKNLRQSRRSIFRVLLVGIAFCGFAMGAPREEIKTIVEREYPSLDRIYIDVHHAPELSLME